MNKSGNFHVGAQLKKHANMILKQFYLSFHLVLSEDPRVIFRQFQLPNSSTSSFFNLFPVAFYVSQIFNVSMNEYVVRNTHCSERFNFNDVILIYDK